jgi:acyl carrier protein
MDDLKRIILDYVKKEYLEETDDREVVDDDPLITGGIVDSFSMVSLKRFLERKYSVQIQDAEPRRRRSTRSNDIAELVTRVRARSLPMV